MYKLWKSCSIGRLYWNPHYGTVTNGFGYAADVAYASTWLPIGKVVGGDLGSWSDVRLADLDGDGRSDYLIVDQITGSVTMYRNTNTDSGTSSTFWEPIGIIAAGMGDGAGIYLCRP